MSEIEIRNRAASKIVKWLLVQINNGEIPDGHMSWSYDPTVDSTWDSADRILLELGFIEGKQTSASAWYWDYKTTKQYSDILQEFHISKTKFGKLLAVFIYVGDFLGFMANDKGQGFEIDPDMAGLFAELKALGYVYSKEGQHYWKKEIYPLAHKIGIYNFWHPDVNNPKPEVWSLIRRPKTIKEKGILSKIRNMFWFWF